MIEAFEYIESVKDISLLLTCEHASQDTPREYRSGGLNPDRMRESNDEGAAELTRAVAVKTGCAAILARWSRFLIDLNRSPADDELILERRMKTKIYCNLFISEEDRQKRLNDYYYPYHHQIHRWISGQLVQGKTPKLISIHSFKPYMEEQFRDFDMGIMWSESEEWAAALRDALVRYGLKKIVFNKPYDARRKAGYIIKSVQKKFKIDALLLEFNADKISYPWEIQGVAEVLSKALEEILVDS
ncbi:N-formylglutamate amidohydrolase [bacterium]|nr:N-formylglutamate amidohydrolase [bacterium]